jgi:outer membrane protein assembly factor BamD
MHKMLAKPFMLLFVSLLGLASCSEYQRVLKSPDLEYKFEKAVEYYNEGKYNHAYQLFEELLPQYRGSSKAADVYWYYAETQFALDDYILAAYHYKNFFKTFPQHEKADEAAYKSAYCNYLESPKYSLDQSFTYKAINELQLYVNTHPNSTKLQECNDLIDELRSKLERKTYEIAKQYYSMELYQSAVQAFNICLDDYPDMEFREEVMFYRLLSAYELAKGSVADKQFQRYRETLTAYNDLTEFYPNSGYLPRAQEIFERSHEGLAELNTKTEA